MCEGHQSVGWSANGLKRIYNKYTILLHLFAVQNTFIASSVIVRMLRRMTDEESIDPTRRVNNSLAFLFVLGCEIEITWPGVKESSSQTSRGIGNRRELFSPRIFISSPGRLLFGFRWAKGARNTSLSRSCALSIFLFLWDRDCCIVRSREWRISDVFRETAVRLYDFVVCHVSRGYLHF